jgi:serine/threonine-protein kinase RsbT
VCEDEGPGIPDIDAAMRDGFSTGGSVGLGIGLPGTRRLMDEMQVESKVGVGTRVVIRKWRKP